MEEHEKYDNDITGKNNINTLSLQNDSNNQLSKNNIQLNNFNQIQSNINANLNINNIANLNQFQSLNELSKSISYEKNIALNVPNQQITSDFHIIEENNQKIDLSNKMNSNNIYNNQNNNIYNYNKNYYNNNNNNNINNYYSGGNNNISTKPYFTSKHVLLNSSNLTEVNECINKDLFQLEKFLPNYKNYINKNNSESINICLKYIKYTHFFFNPMVTNKVNQMLYKIIYSDNYNNYENNSQNNEIYNFKKKIKELYKNLIPFDLRKNYLIYFFDKNYEKKLYNLFINDLNKYQRYDDKKYYLYEIFGMVEQKMDNNEREEISNYFNKLLFNSKNQINNNYINSLPLGNNSMNNENNGGNYSNNYNNYHNKNGRRYRKYSYQSPNSENSGNNINYNNYDNGIYKNNTNNDHHINYNNNNYNNLNIDNESYKNIRDNNYNHNSSFQRNNNYKGSFSSRHYFINNTHNKNINLRNKGINKKNPSHGGVLVEVDSTPQKSDIENDTNDIFNKEEENEQNQIYNKEEEKEEEKINDNIQSWENERNQIYNKEETKEEKINDNIQNGENENQNEVENLNNKNEPFSDINKEDNMNKDNEINYDVEDIDLENNLNINNENSKKENIYINEYEQLLRNEEGSDLNNENENENIFNDFNSINPFNENVTSSEENNAKEDSNNQLILKKSQSDNNIININNKLELNTIENKSAINNQEENVNSLIQNIINDTQNNMINSALYENKINIMENEPTNDLDQNDIRITEENKDNEEIKNENNNKENYIDIIKTDSEKENINENIINKKSRSPSPKIISLSDNNIINVNPNLNINNSNIFHNLNIKKTNQENNSINTINNNNLNNNINNDQLQILKLLASQNYNLLMNINPFHNTQALQSINHNNNNNLNNIQINNNINNNMNNLNNLNCLSNSNSNVNIFNNNFYYPNMYHNYSTIFFNYWNDENNLLSKLKNKALNIHSSNYNSNINYINKKAEKLSIEYEILKKFEKDRPETIKEFINLFEEKIILPIYAKINEENQIKKVFYTEIYNKYKNIIVTILSKHNLEDTKVEPFGSIVNNFMTEWGDIDICIVPKDNSSIQSFWEYLDEIKEEVTNVQKIAKFTLIERYPRFLILKLKDIEANIDLDITVQNLLPILNTRLIRQYSLLDQRFHILGIFLKFWVKKNKIHGALDKFLSSYALLILVIYYLQNIIEPKILPILQQIQNIQIEYIYHNEERELKTNLYFEEDLDKINNYMNIINDQRENNCSVVELLIGFFEFYAYKYNHYLISISRSDKKLKNEDENIAFPLEDPFDTNYNPGKSMKLNTLQYSLFIYCMKKELNNILSGYYFKYNAGE